MFRLALLCQAATLLISWPAWNIRERPINLPLFGAPEVSFGYVLLAGLAAAWFFPRVGTALHGLLLVAAWMADQHRLQPQVISLLVLMWATTAATGAWFGRWYLSAMWLWAGLHKLFSREWFGCLSWSFMEDCGLDPEGKHLVFAAGAAVVEIGLGLAAILAPRWAAPGCLFFHLGVFVSLSPLFGDHNVSVWPWNIGTAIVGYWLLRGSPRGRLTLEATGWRPATMVRGVALALLFVVPAGYYPGWVNSHLAFVLYSGHLPHALHSAPSGVTRLDGWTGLTVPFPDSPRLFREVFRRTGAAGDKLHIHDPRRRDPHRYYIKTARGEVKEITRRAFHQVSETEANGVELESRNEAWRLRRAGAKIERDEQGQAFAITLEPLVIPAKILPSLTGLPNLREVMLCKGQLGPGDLNHLGELPRLEILELEKVGLPPEGLTALANAHELRWLQIEEIPLGIEALATVPNLAPLEVLRLRNCGLGDEHVRPLGSLGKLSWLDLTDNPLTDEGLECIASMEGCEWLVLSGTRITSDGLRSLVKLRSLERLELSRTAIGDESIEPLGALAGCQHLDVTRTKITPDGARQLRAKLPGCKVVYP